MKNSNTVYIHIGLPKTGTTTLQKHLFENHSQIYYLGKFSKYGFVKDLSGIIGSRIFLSKMELKYEKDDIHLQSLENQLEYACGKKLRVLLSKEGLAGGNESKKREVARSFLKNFPSCKIILFVREPESFVKSLYTQMLKAFQTRRPHARPAWMKLLAEEPPHYFDINEWLDASWQSNSSPKDTMSYADTARIYADTFGKENVKIFIFEEFARDPKIFVSKLCEYLGIDAEEGLALMDGKRENVRHSAGYIDLLKEIEKSPALSQKLRASGCRKRIEMLTPKDNDKTKIIPALDERWLKEIHAHGDSQNRRLANEWGLPLTDYGYRV